MIYMDNAATTWPKPPAVRRAVEQAFQKYGANPGRGGHTMSMNTAAQIFSCREAAAELFHAPDPTHVIFTQNCTHALNMAIHGCLQNGGRAIISDLEHNSVVRPLYAINPQIPIYDIAKTFPGNDSATVNSFESRITKSTKVIVCTHASNVFGSSLPIRQIGEMAKHYGLLFIVDGAQSAGVLPINMQQDNIDFLCVPGHKGLYGPTGTGMLICNSSYQLTSLTQGGTGSNSLRPEQPDDLPDRLESGTVNTIGICGLLSGIQMIKQKGISNIARHEIAILQQMYRVLKSNSAVLLYTNEPAEGQTSPVLSFNIAGKHSEETAAYLNTLGIAVRAGLHCSPLAHRKYNTINTGTVRLAPSVFTTSEEAEFVCKSIVKYAQNM